MKVKMIKMGGIDVNSINCRIRGIVVTEDNKHLVIEIGTAYSPSIGNTSLSKKEYNLKYPNPEYLSVSSCHRVDIPEDFYKNSSKEYSKYTRENFFEIPYTKEGIVQFLKKLNTEIEEIEQVDDYYIDDYCNKNGFYQLYDERLKHNNKILEIRHLSPRLEDSCLIKYQYTCYAKNGTEYSEIAQEEKNIKDIIEKYGKENVKPLVIEYIKEISNICSEQAKEKYNQLLNEVFENTKTDLSIDFEEEYSDI